MNNRASYCDAEKRQRSAQRFFVFLEELIVDFIERHFVDKIVNDDRVAAVFGIKLGIAVLAQKLLCFRQSSGQPEAQAQRAVARGRTRPDEDLIQVHLAGAGKLGQGGFGQAAFQKHTIEQFVKRAAAETLFMFSQKKI